MKQPLLLEGYLKDILPAIEKNIKQYLSHNPRYPYWEKMIWGPFYELFSRGGKRLRAILCCLIYHSLIGKRSSRIYRFSIIPEIMHNSSLIIDDIQDNAYLRREKPALHKIYGEATAINTANFLQFYSQLIIKKSSLAPAEKEEISGLILQELSRCYIGQGMDILWSKNHDYCPGMKRYLQMASLKTGSLFEVSFLIGAILAGASIRQIKKLEEIARIFGIAFQVQDDLSEGISGDIREGKLTYPVAYVFSKSRPKYKEALKRILVSSSSAPHTIKQAVSIMQDGNAFGHGRAYIRRLLRQIEKDLALLIKKRCYMALFRELLNNTFPDSKIIPPCR